VFFIDLHRSLFLTHKLFQRLCISSKCTYFVTDGLLAVIGADWQSIEVAVIVGSLSAVSAPSEFTSWSAFFVDLLAGSKYEGY
jgi:hypothetical protein